jgi:hypothetical protein
VVESVKVVLLFISKLACRYFDFLIWKEYRKRRDACEIYSLRCGLLICYEKSSGRRNWTLMCPTNVLDCMMYMVRNLKNCITEKKVKEENHQSAWIVGENSRISNWDWNPMLYKDAVNRNQIKKEFRNDSFFKLVYWNYGVLMRRFVICVTFITYVENGKFDHEAFIM